MNVRFIGITLFFLIVVAGFVFFKKSGDVLPTQKTSSDTSVFASPFPFMEMTIPYLRGRKYESKLGSLGKLSQSSSYTSYLTSYDSDGLKIYGLLTEPAGQMPAGGWPAIVFVHGYIPPALYKTTEKYVEYVDALAKSGFVVFKIDLRGHDKSEGDATGAYTSGDYVVDALNARAALSASDFVNKDKIGLWGHSMAGNVTFRSFVAGQNIPALVIWAGAVYTYLDQKQFGLNDNSYRPPDSDTVRQRRRKELTDKWGDFNRNSDFWKQVVPTNYLDGVKGAVQIHHAVDDTVVNIGYSRGLIALLDKTNIPHELYEYPTGGHNISGSSFNVAMQRTIEFFKKNLD